MDILKTLFDKARIKYIVSVDNCYASPQTCNDFEATEYCKENILFFIKFCEGIARADIISTIEDFTEQAEKTDYIESAISGLTEEHKELLKQAIQPITNEESIALKAFCEQLKASNIIEKYETFSSTSEALNCYSSIGGHFEINNDSRILWLVDNNFEDNEGTTLDGQKFIQQVIENDVEGHIFALCTAQDNIVDSKHFRELLNVTNANRLLLACLVKKHHIINQDYPNLFHEMYLSFRENYSGEILTQLHNVLDIASSNSTTIMSKLEDETINKVIMLGSVADGVSPIETFQRLMMIIIKSDITSTLGKMYDSIASLVHNYAELCRWSKVENISSKDFEAVGKLREKELYNVHINSIYSPVGYGDIFEINNKYFLLMAQSCNVSIRGNGERSADCATLTEIKKSNQGKAFYSLDYFNKQSGYYVSFNNTINIDFNVLDLCSLNNEGKLSVEQDFKVETVKYRYSHGVYDALQKAVSHNHNLHSKYNTLSSEKNELKLDEIIGEVREIYKDNFLELNINFSNGITYNGRRICRLNKDVMDDVIKQYSEYHSRKALDFDFTKKFQSLPFTLTYNFDFSKIGINSDSVTLQDNFLYLKTEDLKDSDLKKKIKNEFEKNFKNMNSVDNKNILTQNSIDIKAKTINVPASFIEAKLEGEAYLGLLGQTNTHINITIPICILKKVLTSTKLKEYTCSESMSILKVSKDTVTFSFPQENEFSFTNTEVVNSKIKFSFDVQDGIICISLSTS